MKYAIKSWNIRCYKTPADRKRALTLLKKQRRYSGFIQYKDVRGYALWCHEFYLSGTPDRPYVQ